MTTRVIPCSNATASTPANGRTYFSATGAQDVPDQDAQILAGNNWIAVAQSGPTSARPVSDPNGARLGPTYGIGRSFLDTTLGYLVVFDGVAWRNPATGAPV